MAQKHFFMLATEIPPSPSAKVYITQKLDPFGETLFFYPVANTFSQTNRQIPKGPPYGRGLIFLSMFTFSTKSSVISSVFFSFLQVWWT